MGSAERENVHHLREAKAAPGENMEAVGLRPLSIDWVLDHEPEPRREVWHGLIGHGETAILFGPGKSSKSLLTMGLALSAVAGGGDLLGQAVEPCAWALVLDAENGARLAHRRLRMLGVSDAHRGRLDYYNSRGANLSDAATLKVLGERVAALAAAYDGPGLVVVDSVVALAAVDEWRAELVREFVDGVRNTVDGGGGVGDHPVTLALVAHTPHGQERPRGSGDWVNAVDVALSVKHVGGPRYQVGVYAARDMGDHLAVPYRMVADTAGAGSLRFVVDDAPPPEDLGKEAATAVSCAAFMAANPEATHKATREALGLGSTGSAKDAAARGAALFALRAVYRQRPTATRAALADAAKVAGVNEKAAAWVLDGKRWDRLVDALDVALGVGAEGDE